MEQIMREIFYLLFFAVPLFSMSLDELITKSLENSTAVKQADFQKELAELKLKESRASRYGELDIVGSATHYNVERTLAPMTPSSMTSGQPITTNKDIYSGGVSYNLPLFTGFAQTRDVEINELASKMSEIKSRLTKEQIIYNIRSLYLAILTQEEIKKAQHSYTNALKKLNKQIAYEVKLGKKAEIDLIKSKADIELSKTKEAILKANIDTTIATLKALSSVDIDRIEPIDVKVTKPNYDIEKLFSQNEALAKVQEQNLALKKADKLIAKSKAQNYPQLNLNSYLGKNYGEDEKLDKWDDETLWQVGLNLKYNILDFGKKSATIQKAKIAKLQASLKKEQTLLDLKKEIIEAVGNIEQNYAQFLGNSAGYELSKKSEKIEKVRYQSDVSTLNDLLLAKAKTQTALSKLIESKYNYQKSIYNLDYLLEKGVK
jgi:outer membrane protein TolC